MPTRAGGGQRSSPAPQRSSPAPQRSSPAPTRYEPAPRSTPAPRVYEHAPRAADSTPRSVQPPTRRADETPTWTQPDARTSAPGRRTDTYDDSARSAGRALEVPRSAPGSRVYDSVSSRAEHDAIDDAAYEPPGGTPGRRIERVYDSGRTIDLTGAAKPPPVRVPWIGGARTEPRAAVGAGRAVDAGRVPSSPGARRLAEVDARARRAGPEARPTPLDSPIGGAPGARRSLLDRYRDPGASARTKESARPGGGLDLSDLRRAGKTSVVGDVAKDASQTRDGARRRAAADAARPLDGTRRRAAADGGGGGSGGNHERRIRDARRQANEQARGVTAATSTGIAIGVGVGFSATTGCDPDWFCDPNWNGCDPWVGWCVGWGWGWSSCWWPYGWSCGWPWYWNSWWYSCWYPSYYWAPYPAYYVPVVYDTYSAPVVYEEPAPAVVYEEPAPAAAEPAAGEGVIRPTDGSVGSGPNARAARDRSDPTLSAKAFLDQGDDAWREGRYFDAVHFYARAVELAPDDGVNHLILADALFATGDYHYAAYSLRKALELDPGLLDSTSDKHDLYPDPKEFDKQLAVLEQYVADHPIDDDARLLLAANYLFARRVAQCVDLLSSPYAVALRETPIGKLVLDRATERK
jgi:hypothetical protein